MNEPFSYFPPSCIWATLNVYGGEKDDRQLIECVLIDIRDGKLFSPVDSSGGDTGMSGGIHPIDLSTDARYTVTIHNEDIAEYPVECARTGTWAVRHPLLLDRLAEIGQIGLFRRDGEGLPLAPTYMSRAMFERWFLGWDPHYGMYDVSVTATGEIHDAADYYDASIADGRAISRRIDLDAMGLAVASQIGGIGGDQVDCPRTWADAFALDDAKFIAGVLGCSVGNQREIGVTIMVQYGLIGAVMRKVAEDIPQLGQTVPRVLVTVDDGMVEYESDSPVDVFVFDRDVYTNWADDGERGDMVAPGRFADIAERMGVPCDGAAIQPDQKKGMKP